MVGAKGMVEDGVNRAISVGRAIWYGATEPARLRWERVLDLGTPFDPLVSVVIPTHNRVELLIERCLSSVLAQGYRKIEVIVAVK